MTADDLEIPLEAQALSIFGPTGSTGGAATSGSWRTSWPTSGSATASAGTWRDIWLNEGFACYAEWLWAEHADGAPADPTPRRTGTGCRRLPQDLLLADPGPDLMFDDRVYKRGALSLHAVRLHLGDPTFFPMLRAWVAAHRYGSVSTDAFCEHVAAQAVRTGGAASGRAVRALLEQWLWTQPLPRSRRSADDGARGQWEKRVGGWRVAARPAVADTGLP